MPDFFPYNNKAWSERAVGHIDVIDIIKIKGNITFYCVDSHSDDHILYFNIDYNYIVMITFCVSTQITI